MWFVDMEVFQYDWLMVAINPMERVEKVIVNDRDKFVKFYHENKNDIWVGFNIRDYDSYIIKSIVCDFNPKEVNDWIIVKDRKGWEFSSLFHKVPLIFYDVMPNPPVSLKALEAFMGKSIHETSVPFDIPRKLTEKELAETIEYCRFDVLNTIEVFLKRKSEFDAQMALLKAFDLPLKYLGKTQAQLAAVILGGKKRHFNDEWKIRLPENLELGKYSFIGDWFLDESNHSYKRMVKTKSGKFKEEDTALECIIAGLPHTVAWGGIHAGALLNVVCEDDEIIYDVDAGQLYPNIMRHYGLLSRAATKPEMLEFVLDTSMRLKAEGKKKEREPYKRQCNIFYGAEGDPTNALYDPLHRNLVCVYGQVFIVDLLEKIEDIVVLLNSNTDGIFFKIKKCDIPELNRRVKLWEERTKLKMEFDEYSKFVSKDVNNYIAVTPTGKIHAKGAYVKDLSDLDYDLPIVNQAVRDYLLHRIPVENTIHHCKDLIKFQKVVKLSSKYKWVEHEQKAVVNNYFTKRGKLKSETRYIIKVKYDNKAYRVFASNDIDDGRLLKCDGVRNPAKFGVTPEHCFIFNDDLEGMPIPDKLDHNWYIEEAKKRIRSFGVSV